MIFGNDRDRLRRHYLEVWSRRRRGLPLDPLGAQIAQVIEEHPEYHTLLDDTERALSAEFPLEAGQSNPFLHMGLHLAIREQVGTDRPAGIRAAYGRLAARYGPHEAEHRIMECLGEALWRAQRSGALPDEAEYLECIRGLH